MTPYAACDLHSNNTAMAVIDDTKAGVGDHFRKCILTPDFGLGTTAKEHAVVAQRVA